ncbi:hypothetical protein [Brevibacterium renqingii]|uniref:hypothetical protein n=1 Tax=Brevibacterium renqingii TaxID=2776916 RepID=UPI001AE05384|nr:hypothetical protein [Brevibacterium renqingii]
MPGFDKYGWFKQAMLGSSDLTHGDRSVLMVFFSYSDGDGKNARPGRQRIIDDACISRSKLDGHLKKLLDLGYLVLTQKGGNEVKKGWANVYRLGIPRRLMEDTRGTAGVSLENPQEAPSGNEGAPSGDTRGTLTVLEGAPSGGPHQTIEHTLHQTLDCVTSNSGELPDDNAIELKDIPTERYKYLLDWIQKYAKVEEARQSGALTHEEAFDQSIEAEDCVTGFIDELFGEDYADYFASEWSIPVKATDRYQAGTWLRTFLRSCAAHGYICYPNGSEDPRHLLVS